MKLKVLIAAFDDGWAFVQEGESLWLVRPPYRLETRSLSSENAVALAIRDPGFESVNQEFAGWSAFVDYMGEKMLERAGRAAPAAKQAGAALLPFASHEVLWCYLARIESELLPARAWLPAQELLVLMIGTERVRTDEGLHRRTAELLKQCSDALAQRQKSRGALGFDAATIGQRFRHLRDPDKVAELAQTIAAQKQLLRPAA